MDRNRLLWPHRLAHSLCSFGTIGVLVASVAPAQVRLPLAEYQALRERTRPPAARDIEPAAPAVLESAALEITAGRSSATVATTLRVLVFADGWQAIALPAAGRFTSVEAPGIETRLVLDGTGPGRLQVRGRGAHQIVLHSVVPMIPSDDARGDTLLVLSTPAAAAVRGKIRRSVGQADTGIELEPGSAAALGARDQNGLRFVAAPAVALRFRLRGDAALDRAGADLPVRFEATSLTETLLTRTREVVRAVLEIEVLAGRLERVVVPLPGGLEVVEAKGAELLAWDRDGDDLVCTLLRPATAATAGTGAASSLALEVTLEGPPRSRLELTALVPRAAERSQVLVALDVQGDGLATLLDPGSARGALEEAMPALVTARGLAPRLVPAAPRQWLADAARTPRYDVSWSEGSELLAFTIDRVVLDLLLARDGRAHYQLWLEVRNTGAQTLELELPPGFELVRAARDGTAVRAGSQPPLLLLPLAAEDRVQALHLAGLVTLPSPAGWSAGANSIELPLPVFSGPVSRVEVRLVLPDGARYALADAGRAGRVAPPSDWSAPPPGFVTLEAAWSALTPRPGSLRVEVTRAIESATKSKEWL